MYKCIKSFSLPKCDDDGFALENEELIIEGGSIWNIPEDKNYRLVDGEVRLESDNLEWIEITREGFSRYFRELEVDCVDCPYSKETACADCCKDWDN